jgi:hypothetical protein
MSFLLEVMGGAGAIWGCAEAWGVRDGHNNPEWRAIAAVVGGLCLARWTNARVLLRKSVHAGSESLAEFLLEVMGGAGAIWGCAEVVGLRVNYPHDCHLPFGVGSAWAPGYEDCDNTYPTWRLICAAVLALFCMAWQRKQDHRHHHVQSVVASFILEVLGGVGAVWGCSEVAYLRLGWGDIAYGQESFDFWRVICAFVFVICFARWCFLVNRGRPSSSLEEGAVAATTREVVLLV